ncbi:MAG: hypothetical protein RLP15_12095 [Cryomorphaceae bacterium]
MPAFNSDDHAINASPALISTFLAQPVNLKEILPGDRIENWSVEGDSCAFKIKGLAEIQLKVTSIEENRVIYSSTSEKPFQFKLIISITGSETSVVNVSFDADVNSFMAMMLKTPLTNFLNSLAESLKLKYAAA